jgi:hypothetical protein
VRRPHDGLRCRECVKQQKANYYNAKPADAAIGAIIALVMGALLGIPAYLLLGMIGFFSFIIAFVAGPAAGGLVAEVIRRALRKRRAQPLKWLAPVCYVIGVLLVGILFFAGIPGASAVGCAVVHRLGAPPSRAHMSLRA